MGRAPQGTGSCYWQKAGQPWPRSSMWLVRLALRRSYTIVIERDTGTTVLVSNGLTGAERVVAHPSPALVEGAPVSVEDAPEPTAER